MHRNVLPVSRTVNFLFPFCLGLNEELKDMDIATDATEVTEDESGSHVNDNSVFTFKEHQGKLAHRLRISIQL